MARTIRASELPALSAFARAYLHEDLIAEYGSAAAAAAAFARDADADERRKVAFELARLMMSARRWRGERLAHFFTVELGAAWAPESADDLHALITALR